MSDRLWIATRKGLFRLDYKADDWQLARSSFLGDRVSYVLPDLRDGSVYAALDLGHFGVKLHRSMDAGEHWEEVAAPTYANDPSEGEDGHSVKLLWTLAPGTDNQPGRLWAGTIPGGLFSSNDRGSSWKLIDSLWGLPDRKAWQGGGYDDPGVHSICVDPRDGACITVGISIGGVWHSSDDGLSWLPRGKGLRAEYVPPELSADNNIQDPHAIRQSSADPDIFWCQHHNGLFVSKNGGAFWTELKEVLPSTFGFALAVHPRDPETAWLVPAIKDETRIPVNGCLAVNRTRDGGQNFTSLTNGLPTRNCYDLIYRHGLDVDRSGNRLAMGSTTGSLWISENGGDNWKQIAAHLPPIYALRFA